MARGASDMLVLGCGAGFSSDRLEPAVALARSGRIDYLVFECVGERTLAFGHRDRRADPAAGYNRLIAPRLAATLPHCRAHGTRIVTSGGRVLCVCALGSDVADAQTHAYAAVSQIGWRGEFHRSDIGWRAIARA